MLVLLSMLSSTARFVAVGTTVIGLILWAVNGFVVPA